MCLSIINPPMTHIHSSTIRRIENGRVRGRSSYRHSLNLSQELKKNPSRACAGGSPNGARVMQFNTLISNAVISSSAIVQNVQCSRSATTMTLSKYKRLDTKRYQRIFIFYKKNTHTTKTFQNIQPQYGTYHRIKNCW